MVDVWDRELLHLSIKLWEHGTGAQLAELREKWAAVAQLIPAPECIDGRLIHWDEDIGECEKCEGGGCGPLQNCPGGGGCGCDPPHCMAKNGRGSSVRYQLRDEGE